MTTSYTVSTRDVDGSTKRIYKLKSKAINRFEDMSGHTLQNVLDDQYWSPDAKRAVPTFETIKYLRDVSNYGCVVTIEINA